MKRILVALLICVLCVSEGNSYTLYASETKHECTELQEHGTTTECAGKEELVTDEQFVAEASTESSSLEKSKKEEEEYAPEEVTGAIVENNAESIALEELELNILAEDTAIETDTAVKASTVIEKEITENLSERLIVLSETAEFPVYGAESVVSYDTLYILSYDTVSECTTAFNELSKNTDILFVERDAAMVTEIEDTSQSLSSSKVIKSKFANYLDNLTSSQETTVAILDTGISRDLESNGRVLPGINIGSSTSLYDSAEHGEVMTNVILSRSNSSVKVLPVKITDDTGKASIVNAYLGIRAAIDNGADVINISMSAYQMNNSAILESAIDDAVAQGIPVVVAAGNDSSDVKNFTPAGLESAITVTATDELGEFQPFSNYGAVDYASVGTSGTSESTANVSAVIATIMSSGADYNSVIQEYAVDLGDAGYDSYYGNGWLGFTELVSTDDENASKEDKNVNTKGTILDLDIMSASADDINEVVNASSLEQLSYVLQTCTDEEHERLIDTIAFLSDPTLKEEYNDGKTVYPLSRTECFYPYWEFLETWDLEQLEPNLTLATKTGYVYVNTIYGSAVTSTKITYVLSGSGNTASKQYSVSSITPSLNGTDTLGWGIASVSANKVKLQKDNEGSYNIIVFNYVQTKGACTKKNGNVTTTGMHNGRWNARTYTANNDDSAANTWVGTEAGTNSFSCVFQMYISNGGVQESATGYHAIMTIDFASSHNAYVKTSSAATCTTASAENYYCSRCDAYLYTTNATAALGHTWPGYWSYDGHNHWQLCGRAADAYMAGPETHSYSATVIAWETCTAPGTTRYSCACGYYYDVADRPALGHAYNTKTVNNSYLKSAATCTNAAVYYYKCDRCSEKGTTTYTNGSALGHAYATAYSYADSNGVTDGKRYKKCSRCASESEVAYKIIVSKGTGIASVASEEFWKLPGGTADVSATLENGYRFANWSGDLSSTDLNYSFTMPAKALRLTANASLRNYIINYDTGKGTINNGAVISYKLTSPDFTLVHATREGYEFKGWTGSNGDTPELNVTIPTGSTGDKSYTANWEPIKYKQVVQVRYENADGSYTDWDTVIDAEVPYDASVVWTRIEDDEYEFSKVQYKVTGEDTVQYTVKRKTFDQVIYARYQKTDGKYTEYEVLETIPCKYGSTFSWKQSATPEYSDVSIDSYTVNKAKEHYVTFDRNKYTLKLNVRYEMTDGTFRESKAIESFTLPYGATLAWAMPEEGKYQATNLTRKVTTDETVNVDILLKSYDQTIKVRYQNLDGTLTDYEIIDVIKAPMGRKVSWELPSNGIWQDLSIEEYTVEGERTFELTAYREYYNCSIQVRYQNADGSYTDYETVMEEMLPGGLNIVWKRSEDESYQAVSEAFTLLEDTIKQISVNRLAYNQDVLVSYENVDGTYTDYVLIETVPCVYGSEFSYALEEDDIFEGSVIERHIPTQNAEHKLRVKRKTYKSGFKIRYENEDGTFTDWQYDMVNNYRFGTTLVWYRPGDDVYQEATATITVNGCEMKEITVRRVSDGNSDAVLATYLAKDTEERNQVNCMEQQDMISMYIPEIPTQDGEDIIELVSKPDGKYQLVIE